jgi:hypothetical protein
LDELFEGEYSDIEGNSLDEKTDGLLFMMRRIRKKFA